MNDRVPPAWAEVLLDAADTVTADQAGAEHGLQILWATVRAITPTDQDARIRWALLQQDLTTVFTALGATPGPAAHAGVDVPQRGQLRDTAGLRAAVVALAGATRGAVISVAHHNSSSLDAAHASVVLEQMAGRWTTPI